jgi:signal peptide peptidase SppA
MLNLQDSIWLGTAASFREAVEIEARVIEQLKMVAGPFDAAGEKPVLFDRQGNTAVISIRGPLINADSAFLDFFGVATYPGIRRALVSAASDSKVEQILLDIDSGGGAVSGVADTGDLIARINAKVKPVTAFTDGSMASAAYWLGASAGKVFSSKTSIVGSIGVIAVHTEYVDMLKAEGIKKTVIRAGEFKALAGPFEKLSQTAKDQIQAQLDGAYKVFGEHVAAARGVSFAAMDSKMGQGREFFGEAAHASNLVDGISTFDGVLSKLQDRKPVDKRGASYDNGINQRSNGMSKAALTEQMIAAIAGGATASAIVAGALAADATISADDQAKLAAAAAAEEQRVAEQKRVAATAKAESDNAVIKYLQTQIAEKDAALLVATTDKKAAEAKLVDMAATHAPLLDIARQSIAKMTVALGGTAVDTAALTPVAVLAEHTRVGALFTAKFPVGGVAVTAIEDKNKSAATAGADPTHAARISAVKP